MLLCEFDGVNRPIPSRSSCRRFLDNELQRLVFSHQKLWDVETTLSCLQQVTPSI